jgi:two-component system chemotaxis sensor kinase CheA
VFLPGFSTKEVASSVSGRGVGMDVVKTAVEKNRGAIRIDSNAGQGHQVRDPPADRTVDRADHAGLDLGRPLALPMAVVERVVELPEEFMKSAAPRC